jgi:hypothetical protein
VDDLNIVALESYGTGKQFIAEARMNQAGSMIRRLFCIKALLLAISLLLCSVCIADSFGQEQVRAEDKSVIVDSLVTVDRLTGSIIYLENYAAIESNWQEELTYIGDYYDWLTMYHYASISYLSFEVPAIPEGFTLESAVLGISVQGVNGNSYWNEYPIFNIGSTAVYPDGILEHIDYGGVFSNNEVIPFAIYGTYPLFTHETLNPPCNISIDVTDCLRSDIATNRALSQYRIYLQGFSDWDNREDFVVIASYSNPYSPTVPKIHYTLTDGTSNNDPTVSPAQISIISYPNPFTEAVSIKLKLAEPGLSKLSIYNLKGQKVRSFEGNPEAGAEQNFQWDGRDDSGRKVSGGIYLAVAQAGQRTASSKILYMK